MDSSKYTEKCLGLLENDRFAKTNDYSTKRIESKIQRCVRKLESKITEEEYSKLYPTGSNPGKFYGTAKSTLHLIYLNILQNYYPRSANHSTQLKIPKNLFLWTVIQSYFLLMCPLFLPAYRQISPQMLYYDEFTGKRRL